MRKRNKKKNVCAITRFWPTLEDMKKDLFIDLEKQDVVRISTNNTLKPSLNKRNNYFELILSINRKKIHFKLHRLFFYWKYGYLPNLVDHKDRNRLNNKIENLRELTTSNNNRNSNKNQNRKRKPSSKHKGVSKTSSNKWQARIRDLKIKKDINLGVFDKEDDAGQAVNDKIRELGLEEVSVMNDTPQERTRENIQFDPLPSEMNHIRDLFKNLNPLDFGNLK